MSSDDYVAEFLDPKHRQKAGFLYDQYKKANNPAGLTFAMWLSDDSIKDSRDLQKYVDDLYGEKGTNKKEVAYLTGETRIPYRLVMRGGKYYRDIDQGVPFDSTHHDSGGGEGENGWAIFVMSPSGYLYAHSKSTGKFHHSSFLSGTPSLSAGCIKVVDGLIVAQNNASGHYRPGPDQNLNFVRELYADVMKDLGKGKADIYMRDTFRTSLNHNTFSNDGPYYSGEHFLATEGKPTVASN